MRQPPGGVPDVDVSADTCSSRVFQQIAHVMLAVVFGSNFITTFSALD